MQNIKVRKEQIHSHTHNHSHVDLHTNKKKLIIVIFFNIVITFTEFVGGVLSGSLALISDAGHNLSDVMSLIFGYVGEKISEKEGSKSYTFGLKRFEVLIALINSLSLVVIGGYIIYEAIHRFLNPVAIDIKLMLPIAIIGLLGNGFSILVLSKNKNTTLNMKAAFMHLFYDTVSSVAIIIAAIILYYTSFIWIDLAISLFIVFMMIWSSASIIKETLRIFMQGAPKNIDIDEISKEIKNIECIDDVHCLHVWSVNSNELFFSCHVSLNIDLKQSEIDTKIISKIKEMLEKNHDIKHLSIQTEASSSLLNKL